MSDERVTWLKWKYRRGWTRGTYRGDYMGQAGKARQRKRIPNPYDPTKHVLVVDGGTGHGRMVHYE